MFTDFDRQLKERGYLAMGGQIVDATLVAAPKQRNTAPEKDAIKAGKSAGEIWPDKPARAAQKDADARWTLKFAKAKPLANGKPGIDIAIPSFGYKSSISICRAFGFIRYVQNHSLPENSAFALAKVRGSAREDFDGVAELWWRDMESYASGGQTPEGRAAGMLLLEDEARFIDLPHSPIFLADENEVLG